RGREDLDEIQDLEPRAPKQSDELAVPELEFGLRLAGPLHAVEAELWALQTLLDFPRVGHAKHRERGVAQEDELAARSNEPRGLGDPLVRIAPDRGAVFGDREIERSPGKAGRLRIRLDELEAQPVLRVHPARGLELLRRDIDAHDAPCAAPFQPGRDIRGPAPELDDVLAANVGKDVDLALGRVPHAP